MPDPTFVYDATTLTFRPGCIQSNQQVVIPRQRRRLSTSGFVRIREVSSVKGKFLRVRLQQLHEDDEGSFAGWTSLESFLKSTVDWATNEFVYTDADGDEYNVRLWGNRIAVREVKVGVWEGEFLLKIREAIAEIIFEDTFTDSDGPIESGGHEADTPSGIGWDEETGNQYSIVSNKLNIESGGIADPGCMTDTDVVGLEGNLEFRWSSVEIIQWQSGTNASYLDLCVRSNGHVATDVGREFLALRISQLSGDCNSPSTHVAVVANRTVAAGADTLTKVAEIPHFGSGSGINAMEGDVREWGLTFIADDTVQLWWEPAGGGARTLIGSPHQFSAAYNDSSHRRLGFQFQGGAFLIGEVEVDRVLVTTVV